MQTKNLNDIYQWIWVVLIILAVFMGVKILGELKELKDADPAYNSITVTGEGEIFAIPDLATFSFTVSAEADSVSQAQEQVTRKVDTILEAIKDLGIEEKDIKTLDYSVYPKYVYSSMPCSPTYCPPGRQEQDGYTANHTVSIKVRDTEKAGATLSVEGEKGATNLSGISFTIDDPDKLTNEARALAIQDARRKAKALTDELGVRLVKVVSFSDSTDGGIMPMYREGGFGGVGIDAAQAKTPTLPSGENKIRVVVNVTYEIR